MDDLPLLPKTKSAWLACFTLIIVLFWSYYTYLYPGLLESYKQQNHVIPYAFKQIDTLSKDLEVNLIIPKSLGADSVPYITISIRNLELESVYLKLRLILSNKSANINRDLALIPLIETIESKEESVQLQPNSFGFIRLPLIFIGDSISLSEELFVLVTLLTADGGYIGQEILSAEKEYTPVVNRVRSSWDFILKKLLLPPLANGVLAGLAIVICWFFEENQNKNEANYEPKYEPVNWNNVVSVFFRSAWSAFGLLLLVYFKEVKDYFSFVLVLLLLIISIYISRNQNGFLEAIEDIRGRIYSLFGR